jgi:osmotically-inducible protein OsmY
MFTRRQWVFLTCALAVSTAAPAEQTNTSASASASARKNDTASLTDNAIARRVQHDLEGLGLGEVHVEVIAGEVTLRGMAPSLGAKRRSVERVYKVPDVQVVDDEMTVDSTSDAAIRADLENKLGRYVHYTIYDHVTSSVHHGRVELQGEVTMPYKVNEIESTLADVTGVQSIDNHIRVLPESSSDETLRIAVAVAVYRDLPEYAMRPVPPIHVVVENGRVTLYGTVADEAEERIVARQARETPGARGVELELQLAS